MDVLGLSCPGRAPGSTRRGGGELSIDSVRYAPGESQRLVSRACWAARISVLSPGELASASCLTCSGAWPHAPTKSCSDGADSLFVGGPGQHSPESDRHRPAAYPEPILLPDQPAGEQAPLGRGHWRRSLLSFSVGQTCLHRELQGLDLPEPLGREPAAKALICGLGLLSLLAAE